MTHNTNNTNIVWYQYVFSKLNHCGLEFYGISTSFAHVYNNSSYQINDFEMKTFLINANK